ncbi:MAG: TlpA family protein disulfide reductase [Actinomycetota bacterium]
MAIGAVGLGAFRSGSSRVAFAGDFGVGGRVEKLSMPYLDQGGRFEYERFRNKPLVVNFFASWCPNCIAEMPGFEEVHEDLGDRVVFLGVSQSDSKAASIDLARQTGVRYPLGVDANGTFFRAVGGGGMPTTLFIKPGGQVAYVQVGALDAATLREGIQRYLGV